MSDMPPPPPPPPPPGPPPQGPGQYGGQPMGMQPKPDNNLVWAILTTLFCCLPFGIVAIVYAAKVDGLYAGGQYAEAQVASANAKKWSIIAAVVGVVGALLYLIFVVILGVASSSSGA